MLSCLPNDAAVEAVYLGAGKLLESARPGARIIELSTIAPETSRKIHDAAAKFDIAMLDVAVSGSTAAAETGALTLFGGGKRRVFESAPAAFCPDRKAVVLHGTERLRCGDEIGGEHAVGIGHAIHR